jgi:membrane-associated phospholipid phosphatase
VLLVVLAVITEQVVAAGPLLAVDRWVRSHVLHLVAENPYPLLDTLAKRWTDFGASAISIPLLTLATVIAAIRSRSWKPVLSALLAGLALFATVIPGKILIGRPGPEGQAVPWGAWGWFPSGHTSTASVCLGTAAWLLSLSLASVRLRQSLYAGTAALCTGVGICLIWWDFHWFLDVVAGWCLSGIILWALIRWAPRPDPRNSDNP